ncbi:MAG TPA: carbon monoxide dehydrogenase, partial [Rhodospirillaceae bacterium]|nr:carbon monoxide dehydrogenase [Rhodospirillaceae bacterium]
MTEFTGTSVHRVEDQRLLTGLGQFVEDIQLPDTAHAVVLRSPIAHGRITSLDISDAMDMPGVLAIYTGADLERLGCHPMPCVTAHPSSDGTPFQAPIRPLLAQDRVRFAGDPVAFIVADSEAIAISAMELIMVDYEEEDAITEPTQSQDIACIWEEGDKAAIDQAFAKAARVVEITQRSDRI